MKFAKFRLKRVIRLHPRTNTQSVPGMYRTELPVSYLIPKQQKVSVEVLNEGFKVHFL